MKLWIRIDTAVRSDPNVAELASRLGITIPEAVGHCVLVWSAIGEHRPNGDLSGISIPALEEWAGCRPRKGRPAGAFGKAFKELFLSHNRVKGWQDRQGKLIEKAEKERARKLRGSSAEDSGISAPTERNGTISTISAEQPAEPEGVERRAEPKPSPQAPPKPSPAPKPKAEPKYPGYPAEARQRLHAKWGLLMGPYDFPRFVKETAGLFPEYAERVDGLELAMGLCVADHKQRRREQFLTPAKWAQTIKPWMERAAKPPVTDGWLSDWSDADAGIKRVS